MGVVEGRQTMGAADYRTISPRMMGWRTMARRTMSAADDIATYDGVADDGAAEDRSTPWILHLVRIMDVAAWNAFVAI